MAKIFDRMKDLMFGEYEDDDDYYEDDYDTAANMINEPPEPRRFRGFVLLCSVHQLVQLLDVLGFVGGLVLGLPGVKANGGLGPCPRGRRCAPYQ